MYAASTYNGTGTKRGDPPYTPTEDCRLPAAQFPLATHTSLSFINASTFRIHTSIDLQKRGNQLAHHRQGLCIFHFALTSDIKYQFC